MVSRVSLWGFNIIYKIGEIIVARSDNSGVRVVGLLCVEQNVYSRLKSCFTV